MRKKTEAKRQAILKVATQVFREMGFENASMAEIAVRLGGSKATLYNYFRSKEEIFIEVMRCMAEEHEEEVHSYLEQPCAVVTQDTHKRADEVFSYLQTGADDIEATLRRFGERFLGFICSRELLAVRRMLVGEAGRSEVGRHFYERGPRPAMARIAAFFTEAMDKGLLRRADANVAAAHLRGLIESEVHERCLLGVVEELSEEEIHRAVDNAVTVFLAAYGANQNRT